MTCTASTGRASERRWRPSAQLDLALTLSPHRRGGGDPAWRRTPDGAIWRTSRTPEGPGTLRVTASPGEVHAQAWGPGAGWLLETLPSLLGAEDDVGGFAAMLARLTRSGDPGQARAAAFVAGLATRAAGLRVGRSLRVFEALAPAVLEQKVVGREAWRAWRFLLRRYGEPAPGPAPEGMYVIPPPEVWRAIPSWDWHRAGAEAVRARTIVNAARHAEKLESTTTSASSEEADRLLRALPGIGVWTSAEVRQRAHGDPDAPSVGDFHLPAIVGYALTGQKADDDGMLDLLEPFRGHRHRVVRLIELSGVRPPARGPRMAPRDYRAF
ncbi:3-methyladenine DNA glycosylase/8-oxoguanine DNA glycosylase [Microbispora rosea]|uniref:DNA-3-methyladenine glycosylase II n=1 Tax=Microbispora rosea TaxID=58117 RepID=A0A1N6TDM0_9ACTN|nr:3-methyladenine DNA glycosylase [Microbispora rosea]GIH45106.1 3-methyladenine DNA glycosylase [Microbispora rosea subsp. rosea]SIQ51391.1 3-methyladenine DNA glycosylase/8-oxoguanine DNA glycosylase [Microbispora rosea]